MVTSSVSAYADYASSFSRHNFNSQATGCYKIPDSVDLITELPNDDSDIDVVLREPIPIRLSFDGVETWMASFEEANIAMPGGTRREAKELLSYDIIATFEYFHAEEEKLIPDLKQALMVLRQYIDISE